MSVSKYQVQIDAAKYRGNNHTDSYDWNIKNADAIIDVVFENVNFLNQNGLGAEITKSTFAAKEWLERRNKECTIESIAKRVISDFNFNG